LIEQKMGEFGGKWVSGFVGKNWEKRGFEGRKWLGGGLGKASGGAVVVGVLFGWCMGEKGRRWEEEKVYGAGKMGERGRENDLKAGHTRAKN
jgi:hypothetical protein